MIQAGTLSTAKEIYWDIRPRADLGTVEFRIFDAPKSFEHLLFLTTLVRLFTLQTLEDLEGDPKLGRGNPAVNWLAEQNRFLASRYGLSARCSRLPGLKPRTLAEDLAGLLTRLSSRTAEQSEVKHLRLSEPLDRFDSGAARQRQLFRKTGRWESVVEEARRNWFAETGDLSPHPIPSRLPAFMDTPPPVAGVSLS